VIFSPMPLISLECCYRQVGLLKTGPDLESLLSNHED